MLVNLILIFYRLSAFFIGNYQFTTSITFIVSGFCGFAFVLISFIAIPAYISQNVSDEAQLLGTMVSYLEKKKIQVFSYFIAAEDLYHLPFQENQKVILEDKIHPALHARDFVARNLEAFKGFDGSGFFTLNKEFLSGVAANFITYLIVLIQFKVGESSK